MTRFGIYILLQNHLLSPFKFYCILVETYQALGKSPYANRNCWHPVLWKIHVFQTITKTHIDPTALAKAEAHHAVVKIPDARLSKCSEIFSPQNTVHATIEFVDVMGLKKGESGSTQFSTHFLSNVKTNDALVQVVRLFENDTVPSFRTTRSNCAAGYRNV